MLDMIEVAKIDGKQEIDYALFKGMKEQQSNNL